MGTKVFRAYNLASGSLSATAAAGGLASGTTWNSTSSTAWLTRTMLQIAPAASGGGPSIRVLGWGYSFASPPANAPIMELVDSGSVFASGLTAHVAAGVQKMSGPMAEPSTVQLGTALTGYCTTAAGTATTEGSYAANATRLLDGHAENGLYFYWRYEMDRENEIQPGNCLRLRATPTTATAIPLLCWIDWLE